MFLLVLGVFGAGCLIWAFFLEPFRYQFRAYRYQLTKPLQNSIRILHLSDIHFHRVIPRFDRLFGLLGAQTFDLVLITGDIMDHESGIPHAVECIKKLKAKYGIYAVFGNHDYLDYRFIDMLLHNFSGQKIGLRSHGADKLQQALEEIGVKVLKNETIEVECSGQKVLIHGVDDPATGKANIRAAMQNYDASKVNLLLTHTIDAMMDVGDGEIDACFSGHSHGGQICFPWIGPVITHTLIGKNYAGGIKTLKGAICSISRGVGTSRNLRLRFLCPPEVITLTLNGEGKIPEASEQLIW